MIRFVWQRQYQKWKITFNLRHHNLEMARNNCWNSLSSGPSPKKKILKWRKKIYRGFPEVLPKNCLTRFPHDSFVLKANDCHAMICPLLQTSIFSSTAKGEGWFLSTSSTLGKLYPATLNRSPKWILHRAQSCASVHRKKQFSLW